MADNDEYRFDEISGLTPEPDSGSGNEPPPQKPDRPRSRVMRNALIVLVLVVAGAVIYRFMDRQETKPITPPVTAKIAPVPIVPKPIVQAPPVVNPLLGFESQMNQKMAALEMTQDALRAEIASLKNMVSGITDHSSELVTRMSELNQTIATLMATSEAQAREIGVLLERTTPKKVVVKKQPAGPQLTYNIQAVIPGRAWLTANNHGDILSITVKEGSTVPGYGKIKLIDAIEGRILTTSGRDILFNKDDM